jgi:hypothetical protein
LADCKSLGRRRWSIPLALHGHLKVRQTFVDTEEYVRDLPITLDKLRL